MVLQALVRYYEALAGKGEIAGNGWCVAKVSYALSLREDGSIRDIICLESQEQKGKKTVSEPKKMMVPEMLTRSGKNPPPNFLCDNSKYFLGIGNKEEMEKTKERFESARDYHCAVLGNASGKMAQAVCNFFRTWQPEQAEERLKEYKEGEGILNGGNIVFQYDDRFAHDEEEIIKIWEEKGSCEEDEVEGVCLVTGKKGRIARTHGQIKGVKDAQPSGALLVSFNAEAFNSYGKEQSYNAPVGAYAAFAYVTALNHLLADVKHKAVIGDTTVVYWAEDADEKCQDMLSWMMAPNDMEEDGEGKEKRDSREVLQDLFDRIEKKKGMDIQGFENVSMQQPFYILGLAPNAARLSVRFFYQDSFENVLKHFKRHYDEMCLERPSYEKKTKLGIRDILWETINKKTKDKTAQPLLSGNLFRSIISGERYPQPLLTSVLGRIRAERDEKDENGKIKNIKITSGRVAIIKAYLLRNVLKNENHEEGAFVMLNENCTNIAYVLGRKFAVLEKIQLDSLQKKEDIGKREKESSLNSTIKDRYFNAACATPAAIFPIIEKLEGHHMKKLEREWEGGKIYYENILGKITDKIEVDDDGRQAIPARLSLEDQGMFILGYYHQRTVLWTGKKKNADEETLEESR